MTAPDPAAPQHESHDDIRARLAALVEDAPTVWMP
jgi:hypothetical protein